MNSSSTGKYIAQKRKEKNLTQMQLAEKLNVSNKTISKWETGACMPDYSTIESLCGELDVTITELINAQSADTPAITTCSESQLLDLLQRIQTLEQQKNILFGILLIIMGIALMAASQLLGGSSLKDFLSGLLLGISIGDILIGVYCTARSLGKQ